MSLQQTLDEFALERVSTPLGEVEFRRARGSKTTGASSVTHVLLHGIGSASGSWLRQLKAVRDSESLHVVAWNAPGYGASDKVGPASPHAEDYAERVWAWLDAIGVGSPVTLVGHSLGAIMSARATLLQPARVTRLVLLSPARGYGDSSDEDRAKRLGSRLESLNTLGPKGMAEKRGAAMVSPHASAEEVAYVKSVMAQVDPAGYTQAAHLLVNANLLEDLSKVTVPVQVASGNEDTITTPESCRAVAAHKGVEWIDLGAVGHACPLEASTAVNALLGLSKTEELA